MEYSNVKSRHLVRAVEDDNNYVVKHLGAEREGGVRLLVRYTWLHNTLSPNWKFLVEREVNGISSLKS